jgi:hypothetical protein
MTMQQTDLLSFIANQPKEAQDVDAGDVFDALDLDILPYKQFHFMHIPLRGLNLAHAVVLPKNLIVEPEVIVPVALSHLQQGELFSARERVWRAETVKNKSIVLVRDDGEVRSIGQNPNFENQFMAFTQFVRDMIGVVVLDHWDLLSPLKPQFRKLQPPPSLLTYAKRDPAWEYHCLVKKAVAGGVCVPRDIQDVAGLFVEDPILFEHNCCSI